MNERIRVRDVRLIDAEGRQVGIVLTEEARRMAIEANLDLVEVAPDSRPPVCKIMDYGKYKYEQKKKHAGKKVHHAKLKELRLRPGTDDHDFDVKLPAHFRAGSYRMFWGVGALPGEDDRRMHVTSGPNDGRDRIPAGSLEVR